MIKVKLSVRPASLITNDSGQSIIETALAIPFLLIMIAGVIDLGQLMYAGIEVASGARAGAQYGAQSAFTEADKSGMVQAAIKDSPDLPTPSPAVSPSPASTPNATATSYCTCADGTASTCSTGDCPTSTQVPNNHRLDYVAVTNNANVKMFIRIPGVVPNTILVTRTAIEQVTP